MSDVLVIDTGSANLRSMLTALERLGSRPRFACDRTEIVDAPHVVLPGVGTYAAAMRRIRDDDLEAALRDRILRGQPTLCVCVGLQILCSCSEESPGAPGLGIVDLQIRSFSARVRVPHMGWNRVVPAAGSAYVEAGHAYFANSYRLPADAESSSWLQRYGWRWSTADYAGSFVAACERGAVLACQFHPELSGSWGSSLLRRWLETSAQACTGEARSC